MIKFQTFVNSSPTKILSSGKIEKINDEQIIKNEVYVDDQFIKLEGWVIENKNLPIDSLYLMMNNQPFMKYDDLYDVAITEKHGILSDNETPKAWTMIFLIGYLETGCHSISLQGISDSYLFELEEKIQLCRN